jgi:hypothetical protein
MKEIGKRIIEAAKMRQARRRTRKRRLSTSELNNRIQSTSESIAFEDWTISKTNIKVETERKKGFRKITKEMD